MMAKCVAISTDQVIKNATCTVTVKVAKQTMKSKFRVWLARKLMVLAGKVLPMEVCMDFEI